MGLFRANNKGRRSEAERKEVEEEEKAFQENRQAFFKEVKMLKKAANPKQLQAQQTELEELK